MQQKHGKIEIGKQGLSTSHFSYLHFLHMYRQEVGKRAAELYGKLFNSAAWPVLVGAWRSLIFANQIASPIACQQLELVALPDFLLDAFKVSEKQ